MERIRSFWVIRDEDEEEVNAPVPNEADTAERIHITTPTNAGMTTRATTDGESAAVTVTGEDSRDGTDDESSKEDGAYAEPSVLQAQRRRSTTPQNSGGPNVAKLPPLGGGLVGHAQAHTTVPAMKKSHSIGAVSPSTNRPPMVNFQMGESAVAVHDLPVSTVRPGTRRYCGVPAFKLEPRKHLHILLSLREHIFMRFVSGHTDHTRQSRPEQDTKTRLCTLCLRSACRL